MDVRVSPETTFQLLYNRQETDVDIKINDAFSPTFFSEPVAVDYYHFGGTVEFPYEGIRPYFAMTVGASRFDLEREGFRDEWRFSLGFGGGFKTYFSERVGIRIDGRVFPTFVNTNGGFFCSQRDGCLVVIEAQFIAQVNASVGVFLAF